MCIIAIKPKNKKMWTKAQLKTMWDNNQDGAGFMYLKNNKVFIDKGYMSFESLYNALTSQDYTAYDLVLHFRISTSGNVDGLNTHPYPVYEKNALNQVVKIGVAHNGVLRDYTPSYKSSINDTQTFIKSVLKGLRPNFIYNKDCLDLIKELIGSNKLAFLSNKGLTLVGEFVNDKGYIYSNTSYKEKPIYRNYPCSSFGYYRDYADDYDDLGSYNFYKTCKADMK